MRHKHGRQRRRRHPNPMGLSWPWLVGIGAVVGVGGWMLWNANQAQASQAAFANVPGAKQLPGNYTISPVQAGTQSLGIQAAGQYATYTLVLPTGAQWISINGVPIAQIPAVNSTTIPPLAASQLVGQVLVWEDAAGNQQTTTYTV